MSTTTPEHDGRVRTMIFSSVYPHDVNKIEKKERTKAELHEVIEWLTGFVEQTIDDLIDEEVTFGDSESDRDAGEDVDVVHVPHQPDIHARVEHHVIGDRIRDPGPEDPSKIDV